MFRSHLEVERRETVSEFPKNVEQTEVNRRCKIKVRFDYRGLPRPSRFFFGGKGSREAAEELRQKETAMWRNVPLQGVSIENTEFYEIYSVYDHYEDETFYFAPMELIATIDSLEDCIRFTCRDEFRRIEFLEPERFILGNRELERIFFRLSETMQQRLREQELK